MQVLIYIFRVAKCSNLLSISTVFGYISDTHKFNEEACIKWKDEITIQIDFGLGTFFVIYFFIRFLAAEDKLFFILSMESIVDFFTVPPVFLSGNFSAVL